MAGKESPTDPLVDPAQVTLEFVERHGLINAAARGVQCWQVNITADSAHLGLLRASRVCYERVGNLRARMEDESPLLARVAAAVLTPGGEYSRDFEAAVDMPVGDLLVMESLTLPHQDAVLAAGILADAVHRLGGGCCAIFFPAAAAGDEHRPMDQGCALLDLDTFGDGLLLADPALVTFDAAAAENQARLERRSLTGRDGHPWEYDDEEEDDEGTGWQLTGRTAAVLRLALSELSDRAWQEMSALDGDALEPRATGLFARLPRITFRQPRPWRRQMARCLDDLAADIEAGQWPLPRCTGEEMALHLAIDHAAQLTGDRPHRVARAIADHPRHVDDFDWEGCSNLLFEDHDVLMLFDDALDGIEDSGSELNQHMGMANLAAADWFEPFGEGRDPARGFRLES